MAVPSETRSVSYIGTGLLSAYAVPFKFLASGDLLLTRTDVGGTSTALTLGTDYTVTGAGQANGGTVTLTVALPPSYTLKIERVVSLTQPTSFVNQGAFLPDTHETALDRLTMALQKVRDQFPPDAATEAYVNAVVTAGTTVTPTQWTFVGDGATKQFNITGTQTGSPYLYVVTVNGSVKLPNTDYTIDYPGQHINFIAAPAAAASVGVRAIGYAKAYSQSDNSTILALGSNTPRALKTRFGQVVNVMDYGAVPDGNVAGNSPGSWTDNAPAFNAAIAAATSGVIKRKVVIPYPDNNAGVYGVRTGIVYQGDGLYLVGDGPSAANIFPVGGTTVLRVYPLSGYAQDIWIENINVSANNGGQTNILSLENLGQSIIRRVTAYFGTSALRSGGLINTRFEQCNFGGGSSQAVWFDPSLGLSTTTVFDHCNVSGGGICNYRLSNCITTRIVGGTIQYPKAQTATVWSNGTTYALGAWVSFVANGPDGSPVATIYRSRQAGNLNHQPNSAAGAAWWLPQAAIMLGMDSDAAGEVALNGVHVEGCQGGLIQTGDDTGTTASIANMSKVSVSGGSEIIGLGNPIAVDLGQSVYYDDGTNAYVNYVNAFRVNRADKVTREVFVSGNQAGSGDAPIVLRNDSTASPQPNPLHGNWGTTVEWLTPVASAATITPNIGGGERVQVTLGQATTIAQPKGGGVNASLNIAHMIKGAKLKFYFIQDGSGGWNVTWDGIFKFTTAWSNAGNTAGKIALVEFFWDGTNWVQCSPQMGWA